MEKKINAKTSWNRKDTEREEERGQWGIWRRKNPEYKQGIMDDWWFELKAQECS